MFKTALFTLAKCPPTDEWIKEILYMHKMEYYSVTKRNEVLTGATKRMNLERHIQ